MVLKYFYHQNKLLLNPEKTNIMIIAKPAIRSEAEDIRINTEKEEVYPKKTIKILGWEMPEQMTLDQHMNW